MNKLQKSKSNPSKLNIYIPSQNGSKVTKNSSRQFLNKSGSSSKKFGVRPLIVTPTSREKSNKEQSKSKIQIQSLNFNVVLCNKDSDLTTPINQLSSRNKYSQSIITKPNFFKSSNIFRTLNKMNDTIAKKKKAELTTKFDFHLLKVLAKGQYGNLYLAYSKESFSKEKVDVEFMIDEFKIQLYCRHPNILPAYGYFFGKSEVYLIMEAGSGNLYRQIKLAGYFSQKKAATYIHQVLKGLAYLHLNGIIHRDIKPQNIIVCGNIAKITDFGWSVITKSDRKTFCGTIDYVSPEVSQGVYYDNKIDCWSIGVLAYEMLVGFPPFEPYKTKKQRPILNYRIKPKFPSTLSSLAQSFILKMISIDPEQRMSAPEALRHPWIVNYSQQLEKNQHFLEGY